MSDHTLVPVIAGPPFCSGQFHEGHAVNQVGKDFWNRLIRLKTPDHPICPMVLDTQGVPTERATERRGVTRSRDAAWIRACDDTVTQNAAVMLEDLARLGILPQARSGTVLTNSISYKLFLMESIGRLWERGKVYPAVRSSKYCKVCMTTLATAQLEKKVGDASITLLAFPIIGTSRKMVVATTQPHTWVNMQGIAVTDTSYCVYQYGGEELVALRPHVPQAKIVGHVNPWQYQILGPGGKICPIYRSSIVRTDAPHLSMLTHIASVLISPSHETRDLHAHAQHYPEIVAAVHHQWRSRKQRYLQEVAASTYETLVIQRYPDLRQGECCWRCGDKAVDLLQEDWFLDTGDIRPRLTQICDNLIRDGRIIGAAQMATRLRRWWSKPHDWAITRSRDYLTPLPLGRCQAGCPDVVRLHLVQEDVHHSSELYPPTINTAILRNLQNRCACGAPIEALGYGMSVWLDSGILPYYLRQKSLMLIQGKDQDVGWFYAITVLGLLLDESLPYEKLQFIGWVLEKPGVKLSKSRLKTQASTTRLQEYIEEYGLARFRSYLLSCLSHKDYVFDQGQLRDEQKYINVYYNCLKFLDNFPEHYWSNQELLALIKVADPASHCWSIQGPHLSALYQDMIRTGELRKGWLDLKNYLLHTFSRRLIREYKQDPDKTSVKRAGLLLTGRLLSHLYGAGLGENPRDSAPTWP